MSNKLKKNVEVNIGPQVNCGGPVESIEINDTTKLICNCSKVSKIFTSGKSRLFRGGGEGVFPVQT